MKNLLILIIGIVIGTLVSYGVVTSENNQAKLQISEAPLSEAPQNTYLVTMLEEQLKYAEEGLKKIQDKNESLQKANLVLTKKIATSTRTYTNKEIGFSFSYPEWFGKIDFKIEKGEQGKSFSGKFANVPLVFGGITKDFDEGREARFLDYRGGTEWMSGYEIKDIDVIGGTVHVLKGNVDDDDDLPGAGLLDGTFGAIVELGGKQFHGLAFHDYDGESVTLEEFESVLKTLVIK